MFNYYKHYCNFAGSMQYFDIWNIFVIFLKFCFKFKVKF